MSLLILLLLLIGIPLLIVMVVSRRDNHDDRRQKVLPKEVITPEDKVTSNIKVVPVRIVDPIDPTPNKKRSRWALKNLPPTTDPNEIEIRDKMRKWQMLNNKIIDSWWDYANASSGPDDIDIVTKATKKGDEVYDRKTLKPIPSIENPGEVMYYAEWTRIREEEKHKRRGPLEKLLHSFNPLDYW